MSNQKQNTNEKLTEKRCSNCNALLAKASLQKAKVEIKCRCGTINTFEADSKTWSEGIVSRAELQRELLQYGISLKRSATLIEKFRLSMISPSN